MDRIVGRNREPELLLHACSDALKAEHVGLAPMWGRHGVGFKGVRYFKTHEEANEDRADGLARCMAALAIARRSGKQ